MFQSSMLKRSNLLKWFRPGYSVRLKSYTSESIRAEFIKYYQGRDHQFVASSKIYSSVDKSLLFVNAGMNQFKPVFLNQNKKFNLKRAVNSQKCIRVGGKHNDLEIVGRDFHHHTFFEMLGSWSFGDYFKKEACEMAWEVLTKVFNLPIENLYVTYFSGCDQLGLEPDFETRNIWQSIGVHLDRVLPFDAECNFWEMGEIGPCGPCTEIHFDRIGNRFAPEEVNVDGSNVIEVWNLVFMQYNRVSPSRLQLLDRFHVDTGMGLERITAILQNKVSNYDTDLFQPIIAKLEEIGNAPPYAGKIGNADKNGVDSAYRIISDHIRMITIAISDGVLPGSTKRDILVKRLLHRAVCAGSSTLSLPPMFMGKLVPVVVNKLKGAYPELSKQQQFVIDSVDCAESAYYKIIEKGDNIFEKTLAKMHETERAFPVSVADHIISHIGYPKDHLIQKITAKNKILNEKELEEFVKEKYSTPAQQLLVKKVHNQKLFRSNLLRSLLSSCEFENSRVIDNSYLNREKIGKYLCHPVQVKILGLLDENGEVVKENTANSGLVYLLLDKSCFYHPYKKNIFQVGQVENSLKDMYAIEEVVNEQSWVLHGVRVHNDNTFPFAVGDTVTLRIKADRWVAYLKGYDIAVISTTIISKLFDKNRLQKVSCDAETLRIEMSGILDSENVLEFEREVNMFIKQNPDQKIISGKEIALLPQDLKAFLVVKHRTSSSSKTTLYCTTGSLVEASNNLMKDLNVQVESVVNQFEHVNQNNEAQVNRLHKQVGSLAYTVNRSEIHFEAKANFRKTLSFLSGRLNTLQRRVQNKKT